jgi:outer membrane protein OmpA-like peptidoglycan-associated protein
MNLRLIGLLAAACLSFARAAYADPDAEGCKDRHFTRLAGFYLRECDEKDFDSFTFAEDTEHPVTIEGRIVRNSYAVNEGGKPPSSLAVLRNYENAAARAGWKVVNDNKQSDATWTMTKDGRELWVQLDYNGGDQYRLMIAEKGGMEQSVTTADDMQAALQKDGHVALQILFDTGKATIKPESQAIVDQVVALLQRTPSLKIAIEGHTDNVGAAASNRTLSQARAASVKAALVSHGIAAARLTATGYGPDKPVADNGSEAGRAQNRRVELVKL